MFEEILKVLGELSATTSSKGKMAILEANRHNENLKTIFKYAYDTVNYTYGVTSRTITAFEFPSGSALSFYGMLDLLNGKVSGHEALAMAKAWILRNPTLGDLFLKVIDRDLKVGVSEKTINKVWKGLIPVPNYCRCDVFNEKNAKKISYPAFIQLKCDGTYREAKVSNGVVTFKTRSGEIYENPVLADLMKGFKDGYYTGEFTIGRADDPDANRAEGNGLINSDNPPYEKIHFTVWDYLTEEEYTLKAGRPYADRFGELKEIVKDSSLVQVVPTKVVNSTGEALAYVSEMMNKGLEGGVLKSFGMKFKNGTSKEQLKIKLKVDVEVRCTGFILGTKGTKYEGKNKVITFENDEGTIKGQCSGMTDAMVEEVTKNPGKYIGKVLSVQFNDLVRAEGHEYYALSHPRFAEWRDDKNETDNLEKAFKLRDMAKGLKSK